ncbi:MAG: Asp-tRNA(Asn)/Glu-tRNA(Gln) amidotransferase subunit GatC [Pseudomonadota bacterium]|nr:Asp-tRNA(Asn)/Glu-tRNA(Gln) amidotransferase subunit GatC [Pseudomonadota bacterium]
MADSSAPLTADNVQQIALLARLQLSDQHTTAYADSLNRVLSLMDALARVDTDGVLPMASPHDNPQPLRADRATEPNRREDYQAIAPATQDGLYLVPKVIE